jgi:hypothetical protein
MQMLNPHHFNQPIVVALRGLVKALFFTKKEGEHLRSPSFC